MYPRPLHACFTQCCIFNWPDRFHSPLACHDDDVSNNQRCSSLSGTYALSTKYGHPLVHINGSDLCVVRTVGINRAVIIWHRVKANVNRLLCNAHPETFTAHESTCRLPYEIVELIIARLTRDLDALKACSLTCRSWYIVAVPHLHHTLILRGSGAGKTRSKLESLSKLHELGLISLVKEIRVDPSFGLRHWFTPQAFSRRDLRYFSAFANVQTLKLGDLEIHRFIPEIERYFGNFSLTLRSIVLYRPHCTPRQLSYFLSFFSKPRERQDRGD